MIAILGAGAWGTALAIHFSRLENVRLWSHEPEHAQAVQSERVNTAFLPNCPLPETLTISADLAAVVAGARIILVVTPVSALRETLQKLKALAVQVPILWACKGFEAGTQALPHEVMADVWPAAEHPPISGVLSGPSFAKEVAQGLPAALTLATFDEAVSAEWAKTLHHRVLRIYSSADPIGVEVGGAVKNIIAIACGVSDGLGYGLNARAALMTRGLSELAQLGVALGAHPQTFLGLSGMGDLMLTCTGALSRNRQVGLALAEGHALNSILGKLGHVAEGVNTVEAVLQRAHALAIEMPIAESVHRLLFDAHYSATEAVEQLLARESKPEWFLH